MFTLEKPIETKTPKTMTASFKSALINKGIRVEDVPPVYSIETIEGLQVKEISTKRVANVDHIISELVRIKPYVVFLREVTKYYGPEENYYHIRLDFIAPGENNEIDY